MLLSPIRLVLFSLGLFLVVWLLAPLISLVDIPLEAVIFIIIYLVFFIFGCSLKLGLSQNEKRKVKNQRSINLSFIRSIALFGFIVKAYDIFFVRGVFEALNSDDARQLAAESEVGILGMIGSILVQFAYIPLIINIGLRSQKLAKPHLVLDTIIFLLPLILSLVMLSRVGVITAIVSILLTWSICNSAGHIVSKRVFYWGFLGLLVSLTISGVVFSARLDLMDYSLLDSIMLSGYTDFLQPLRSVTTYVENSPKFVGQLIATYISTLQYYLHGIGEFFYLLDNRAELEHGYGQVIFAPILKAMSILFGFETNFSFDKLVVRSGVFISHFGMVWIEFGWWAIVFGFFLGYFIQSVTLDWKKGNLAALPLLVYLCIVILFMPMADFLTMGNGNYRILVLSGYWLVLSRLRLGSFT